LWDFPWRSLAAREVLTYEVASALGYDIVPETLLADGPHGRGSAQAFVEEDFEFDPRTLFKPRPSPQLWPVAVLDIICNNADRKLGHIIRQVGEDRLWAIDNGLTFHPDPKLRTVLWGFAGAEIPGPLLAAVERLRGKGGLGLVGRVTDLLTEKEAEAFGERVEHLAELRVHPLPPEDRPALPWPLF
jgi:uncharacterized repeat protein (TIGR03843 family)